jgi:hypothetical protein
MSKFLKTFVFFRGSFENFQIWGFFFLRKKTKKIFFFENFRKISKDKRFLLMFFSFEISGNLVTSFLRKENLKFFGSGLCEILKN